MTFEVPPGRAMGTARHGPEPRFALRGFREGISYASTIPALILRLAGKLLTAFGNLRRSLPWHKRSHKGGWNSDTVHNGVDLAVTANPQKNPDSRLPAG